MKKGGADRKDLLRLLDLLQKEERALDSGKLDRYKPHSVQDRFHKSDKKVRMVVAGNRFGKTTMSVIEAIWLALGIHPYHPIPVPNRGKMYGDSFPTVMETFVPKFEEWIPREFLDDRKPYEKNQMQHVIGVNFKNGSEIRIGSYDQEERKAEGSNWQYIAFDEPPSRELYIANMRGLIDTGGLMWFSMTPLSEPWIYDELWVPGETGEKPYIECFGGRSDENPHIDHDALNLFLEELTPEEREVRFEGKFRRLTGLVIDTYDPAVHDVDEFDLDYRHVIYEGIDPHPMKPHCALWRAVDKDGIRYTVDEVAFTGSLYEFGKLLVAKRQQLCSSGAVMAGSVVDTIINTKDMANRLNMKDELVRGIRDAGGGLIPSSAMKMDQFNPGIEKERDLFRIVDRGELGQGPMHYVFKRCRKYKYELLHYQWPDNVTDTSKPKAKDDDYIACSRYLESIGPHYHTPGNNFIRNNSGSYRKASRFEKTFGGNYYGTR